LSNKRERNAHVNDRMRTSFANSGRIAGDGILYDDYSEESWGGGKSCDNLIGAEVRLPHDGLSENELALLSGPVRTYKMPKEGADIDNKRMAIESHEHR
jgi:hypothetical protein